MLDFLKHPLTRDLDIDDPHTTLLRKQIIKEKPFLRKIYEDWYVWIASNIPQGEGKVLELGSGAGFLDEHVPGLITTEVFFCAFVDMIMDGCRMPFQDGSLKAIAMVDVFHHIPDVSAFLSETSRCLVPGGKILMVEPWITPWSRLVYTYLHHEPMDTKATKWSFPVSGPLSGANSALPWIVFERDRSLFEAGFPQLFIESIRVEKPLIYILSGGVSLRSLMPGFSYRFFEIVEYMIMSLTWHCGMFAKISILKP